jgi:plastocyanin
MNCRLAVAMATTTAIGITAAGAAGTAGAATPKKNEIRIVGHSVFKAGRFAHDDQRFKPLDARIKSGATVTLRNKSKAPDPHTITFVEKAFLPTGFESAAADAAFAAHSPQGDAGPFFAKIDDGQPAVDQSALLEVNTLGTDATAGDSEFLAPGQKSTQFKVTADAGSKLYYFCAIHPWMQGKISVK